MSTPDWISDVSQNVAPLLPSAFGALIGLKWTKDQTPPQKVVSFVGGFGVSVFFTPALGEWVFTAPDQHPKSMVALGILVAIFGMDVLGGVMVVANRFRNDPLATAKDLWELLRGLLPGGRT